MAVYKDNKTNKWYFRAWVTDSLTKRQKKKINHDDLVDFEKARKSRGR